MNTKIQIFVPHVIEPVICLPEKSPWPLYEELYSSIKSSLVAANAKMRIADNASPRKQRLIGIMQRYIARFQEE
jgi:hypothetical protein